VEGRPPEAVLITGVFGSGKSSVAVEIADVLERQGLSYGVLDLDFLAWFHTASDDPTVEHRMRLTNLAPVVGNYLAAGCRFFILAGALRNRSELDSLKAALPMPLRVVRLTVPWTGIEKRLRSDVTTGRQDDLRDAAAWVTAAEGVGIEDLTVSNDRSIREVAGEILDWLGWKQAVGSSAYAPPAMESKGAPAEPRSEDDRTKELVERLFQDAVGALELYTVYLGERLGLYRTLAEGGPATSSELAERTGTAERYVREWLEHHASSGLLDVDDAKAEPLVRKYRLPPEHFPVLADADDVRYQAHKGVDIVRAGRPLPQLVEAFRTGDAPPPLSWEPEGKAEFNRALFLNLLGREWLPAIRDIDARLRADPPARIADVACGTGWSSIAIAQAYPMVIVDGFDLDRDVIAAARRHADTAGVADRVSFSVTDASDPRGPGGYDLVTIIEALHDMSRPVDALRAAREMLVPGGALIVVDELVQDEFTAPASDQDRYGYGWSVVSCLPGAMGDPQTRATGAVMRPSILRQYATEAGFRDVEVLPIETDHWRFYRLIR
jgi:hypothetical protein